MKMMKILKVLIVVGLLVAPFLAPGASEAGYSFAVNGWGDPSKNTLYSAIGDPTNVVGEFEASFTKLKINTGVGNPIDKPVDGSFYFNLGTWDSGTNTWKNGYLTMTVGSYGAFGAQNLTTSIVDPEFTGGRSIMVSGFNLATIDTNLAIYLGIPLNGWSGSLVFSWDEYGRFMGVTFKGLTQSTTVPTPIPPTALLFGAGLVGLGVVRKRIK